MRLGLGLLTIMIVLFIAIPGFAYYGEAGPVLWTMNYGARAISMGGAFVAVSDDPFYLDANPAGGQANTVRLSAVHQEWIEDINHESLRFTVAHNNIFWGLGYTYMYQKFTHYDFTGVDQGTHNVTEGFGIANFGYRYNGFAVGINAKFYHYNVPSELYAGQNFYAAAGDFGVIYRTDWLKSYIGPDPSMTFGLTVKNIGVGIGAYDKLPLEAHIGVAYRPARWLMLTGEFVAPFYEPIYGAVGAEVNINKRFFFNAGVQLKENPMLGLGVGVRLADLYVYGSYSPMIEFRSVFNVSVSYRFGEQRRLERAAEAQIYLAKALALYSEDKFEEALVMVDKVLELERHNSTAIQLRENILAAMSLRDRMNNLKSDALRDLTESYEEKLSSLRGDLEDEKSQMEDDLAAILDDSSKDFSDVLADYEDQKRKLERSLQDSQAAYNRSLRKLQDDFEEKSKELANATTSSADAVRAEELKKSQDYSEGLQFLADEEYAKALVKFREVKDSDSNYLKINEYIAITKASTKTVDDYERALLDIYVGGLEHFASKDYEGAIASWEEVLKADPYNKKARDGIKEAKKRLRTIEKIQ